MKFISLMLFIIIFSNFVSAWAQDEVTNSEDSKKKPKLVAIPTLSADRSKGVGGGVISMYFFKLAQSEETPLSRLGFVANATTHDNYTIVLFQQLFTKDDEWRIQAAEVLANSNFQTYVSNGSPDSSMEVPYNNYFRMMFANVQKNLHWHNLHLGPQVTVGTADSTFELKGREDVFTKQQLNSYGLILSHDTRKNKFNPDNGDHVEIRWNDFPEWFGNNFDFESLSLHANNYRRLSPDKVLATRLTGYLAYGDVPFVGERFVGNKDLRGYTQGEYRGDEVYTLQSELRWSWKHRWGMVGFGGLAIAEEEEGWTELLPAVGTGLRYQLLQEEQINAGFDLAFGKSDYGFYFRITEAF